MDVFAQDRNYVGQERNTITLNVNRVMGDKAPHCEIPNDVPIPGQSTLGGHPNAIIGGDPLFVVVDVHEDPDAHGGMQLWNPGSIGGRPEVASCLAGAMMSGDPNNLNLEPHIKYIGTAPILDSSEREGVRGRLTATVGGRRLEANQSKHTFLPGDYRVVRAPRTATELRETIEATGKRAMQPTKDRPGLYTDMLDVDRDYFRSMRGKIDAVDFGGAFMDMGDPVERNIWGLYQLARTLSPGLSVADFRDNLKDLVDRVMRPDTDPDKAQTAAIYETTAAAYVNHKRSSITSKSLEHAGPGSVKLVTS